MLYRILSILWTKLHHFLYPANKTILPDNQGWKKTCVYKLCFKLNKGQYNFYWIIYGIKCLSGVQPKNDYPLLSREKVIQIDSSET